MIALPPPFVCQVIRVHDGDGPLWCASGQKVRIAGVQAPDFTSAKPCHRASHPAYTCNDAAAERSKAITTRLTLGQTLTCQPLDRSYQRVVAACTFTDGTRLECAVTAAGAAGVWVTYWRRYHLKGCGV